MILPQRNNGFPVPGFAAEGIYVDVNLCFLYNPWTEFITEDREN